MNEVEMLLGMMDVVYSLEDKNQYVCLELYVDRSGAVTNGDTGKTYFSWADDYGGLFHNFAMYVRGRFQQ